MLDQETRRRIDSCRDILVGKVPDPKSQVEQITIALIYKFMDDMDKESVEMGGKASFFTGEYEKYSWTAIFDPRIGGHELTKLYGEAIEKMNQNPNIPQLFRDIFKNAYLPYRDPETLKLFLKEINNFDYSHSEKLGDAFEYLLSFMGTQGDAGQFRTPRHIIDIIAEVVNPQKHETILDPACGTAGFLISAYKHILSENDGGKKLTPTERKRMLMNFSGYDISPDMVRLSLVNLYLHGFQDPKIYEYDTLTSEERWDESVDVILANPPFMTPKGGIRPHKRFSVQAKRSEVLFVDYIAEHLNPNGRAGVIVPEGIIFQSSNAYKDLRKMLVEDYLWAVVSLPAGVFQPYSGVKTSILLMDKAKAKQNDSILFVKVENDGFDLGAQRRPIDKNDLPDALHILNMESINHVDGELTRSIQSKERSKDMAHWVEKSKIADIGDWNLSGERYKTNDELRMSNYEVVELGDVVEILDKLRKPITKSDRVSGKYPYYGATGIVDWVNEYIFNERLVLLGEDGAKWSENEKSAFIAEGKYWVNNHAHVLKPQKEKLIDTYLVEVLNVMDLNPYITGITVPKLNQKMMRSIQIPLPPLSVQEEIVAEIEGYQKIIDGARQVVENYKPTIKINPDWEMVKLGEVVSMVSSGSTPLGGKNNYKTEGVMFIRSQNILKGFYDFSDIVFITEKTHNDMKRSMVRINDVLLNITGASIGRCALYDIDEEANVNQHVAIIRVYEETVSPKYLMTVINSSTIQSHIDRVQAGGSREALNYTQIKQFHIPLPSLSIQQEIVAQIEAEQEMVNANKKLVGIYEQKIKDKIGEVWGN